MIDITITALNRPEILEKTLDSFTKNIIDINISDYNAIVNIDMVIKKDNLNDMEAVIKKHFRYYDINICIHGCFPKAVDYVWSKSQSPYILHLEDDWVLTDKIEIKKIISDMISEKKKISVLRAYNYEYDKMPLSPSIISKDIYKSFCGNFDYNTNPEIQLRKPFITKEMITVIGKKPIVKDIGREWVDQTGLKKPNVKKDFTSYEIRD